MSDRHRVEWNTYRNKGGHVWVARDCTTQAHLAQGWAKTKTEAQDAARKFSRDSRQGEGSRGTPKPSLSTSLIKLDAED